MRKGADAITLAVSAIVGVAIVVFLFSVLGFGQQIAEFIQKFILGQLSPGVTSKELADAIECSYLRCTQGCAATRGITVEFPSGSVNCKTHCEAAVAAEGITDGKLCGEAAKNHPLEVWVSESNMYISTDSLKFIDKCKDENVCCIVPSEGPDTRGNGLAVLIKNTLVKKIEIGKDGCEVIYEGTQFPKCSDSTDTYCGADTITINTGKYYVWTDYITNLAGRFLTTIVWDTYSVEPIKGANFVCCSGAWQEPVNFECPAGTKQDANVCDPSATDYIDACAKKCTAEGYMQSFYETDHDKEGYQICNCMCEKEASPSFSISVTPSEHKTAAGRKVIYTINLKNNLKEKLTLMMTGLCPSGWACEYPENLVAVDAGGSSSVSMAVTSAASATPGKYTVSLKAETLSTCPSYTTTFGYEVVAQQPSCGDYTSCVNCLANMDGECYWCDTMPLSDWCAQSGEGCFGIPRTACPPGTTTTTTTIAGATTTTTTTTTIPSCPPPNYCYYPEDCVYPDTCNLAYTCAYPGQCCCGAAATTTTSTTTTTAPPMD